ncbi:HK97 family phage prohead protease [Pseudahrensia aquimaris]|uniref:HK97 family phage prohead protease n=1 Tax=Pseudahrensia aquimaris TaxID=744461 RepID=A0ABW3FBP8_9HYPH
MTIDTTQKDGTFSGYASLFGKVDLGKDRVEAGAFAASLRTKGASDIRMLFQHDPSDPIGVWQEIREDERGLYVKGKIADSSARGAEVLALMRSGAIDGLSIGFRTVRSRLDRKTGIRSILQADLWEVSIVTFPMLPQARVMQLKNNSQSTSRLPSLREFERWLTQDAGLSRGQARTVIRKGFAQLEGTQDAAANSSVSAEAERKLRARLRLAAKHFQQESQ